MSIFINPGAGNVEQDLGFEQAYKNMLQFIEDCEVPLSIVESKHIPEENGRYNFTLELDALSTIKIEVDMPSLPLEKVRYMGEETQNIWDFPRLYVDGSSWVWKYAIITKQQIIEQLQSNIDREKQETLKTLREIRDERESAAKKNVENLQRLLREQE